MKNKSVNNTSRAHASKNGFQIVMLACVLVGISACSSHKIPDHPDKDTLVWYRGHMIGRWGNLSFETKLKLIDEVDDIYAKPSYLVDHGEVSEIDSED